MRKGTRILLAMLLTVLALFAMTVLASAATDGATEKDAAHVCYIENEGVTYYYATWDAAIDAVPEGGTVYLLRDSYVSGGLTLSNGKSYTIDGAAAAKDDTAKWGAHAGDGKYALYAANGQFAYKSATTLNLKNIELLSNTSNYGINITAAATVNLTNTRVAALQYTVHLANPGAVVNFLGDKNVAEASAEGVIRNNGSGAGCTVNIEGGTFIPGRGQVFYAAAAMNVNVSDGVFYASRALCYKPANITMNWAAGTVMVADVDYLPDEDFANITAAEFTPNVDLVVAADGNKTQISVTEDAVFNGAADFEALAATQIDAVKALYAEVDQTAYKSFTFAPCFTLNIASGVSVTVNDGWYFGAWTLAEGASLTVNGGYFEGDSTMFAMAGISNTSITLNDGKFECTTYYFDYKSAATGNKLEINGGTYAQSAAWFIYAQSGASYTFDLDITGGSFRSVVGGVYMKIKATANISGCDFVYTNSNATNTTNFLFNANTGSSVISIGEGIYRGTRILLDASTADVTVSDCDITFTKTNFNIYAATAKLTLKNCRIADMSAAYEVIGTLNIEDCEITATATPFTVTGTLNLKNSVLNVTGNGITFTSGSLTLVNTALTSSAYAIFSDKANTRAMEISGGSVVKGTMGVYFTMGTTTLTVTGKGTQVIGTKYSAVQVGNNTNTNRYNVVIADGALLKATNANGSGNNCYAILCRGTTTDSSVTLNGGTLQGYTYGAIGVRNATVSFIINSGTISTAGRWIMDNNSADVGASASTVTLNGGLLINTNADGLTSDSVTYPMFKDITPTIHRAVIISNATKGTAVNVLADGYAVGVNSPVVMRGDVKYYVWMMQESTDASLAPTMEDGAQIRADIVEAQSGIRFVTTLSAEVQERLLALKNAGATLAFGTLIAPTDYVAAAGEFTRAALDALNLYTTAYVDIPAVHSVEDSDGNGIPDLFHGMLVGIKLENKARHFAACSYVKVTDGSGTNIYYSAWGTDENSRAMQTLSVDALLDLNSEQTVDYLFPSIYAAGSYSRYSEKAQTVLNVYAGLVGNVTSLTLTMGETGEQLLPELASELVWESADSSIARVENGYITGVYEGQTVVTATTEQGAVMISCTVTVERPTTGTTTFTVANQQELERALSEANAKDTIALHGNVVITQTIEIEKTLTFTGTAADSLTGDGITKLFDIKAACNLTLEGEATYDYTASTVTDSTVPMVGVSVSSGTVHVYVNGGDIRALHGCFLQQNGSAATLYAVFNGGVVRAPYAVRVQSGTGRVTLSGSSLIVTGSASSVATAAISLESTAATNTLVFTKGSITACREGELGYNAADTKADRGVYVGTDTKLTATFGTEASIATKGIAIYTENLAAATVNINGGQYTSEESYVVFFDAKPCATGGTPATLNVKGGSFIGNDEAETTLYVTCSNQEDESVGTLCNIYDGYFYNDKWSAVRASHGGVLKLYGGYYAVMSGGGAPVVAGTGDTNYAFVDVYGGSFVHGKQTVGSLFLNASDVTRLTLHGMYNGKGGAVILASNAATATLGTQPLAYATGTNVVQNSIYHQGAPVIRLNETAPGITFTGVISEATIAAITAAGGKNLTYGTLFTLAEPLAKRQCAFTKAELTRYGISFVDVVASDGLVARDASVGGGYSINASLTDIAKENYMRQYAVTFYVQYTVNGNTVTQYSCYDATADASSAAAAANDMLAGGASLTATELAIVQQFVVPVTVNGVSLDSYTVLVDDTTVAWSEIVGYVGAELKAITGTELNVKAYTSALQSANRSIVLAYSSSLSTMQYQISISGDDITIKVGSLAAAYTLAIVFMEETLAPNDNATLAVTLAEKTALAGKDYKVSLAAGSTMRAMTFNTLGGGDYNSNGKRNNVIASVAAYAPDFAGMQEHYNDTTMDAALAELGYAKAGATILSLCPDADEYDEEWGRVGNGTSTEIYYNQERFTLVEEDAFLYHWEYRCVHSGTKSVSYGVFEENATGKYVIVINMHGAIVLSDYTEHGERTGYVGVCTTTVSNNVEGNEWRIENAKTVLALLDELRAKYADAIVLVTGDMNDSEDNLSMRLFEQHEALTNVLRLLDDEQKDAGPSYHSLCYAPTIGKPIDHIYVTEDAATVQYHFIVKHQLTLDSSDHCPVVADFAAK